MLGNLFKEALSSFTQSSSKQGDAVATIESVQEDIHTRGLLFPDAEELEEHAHSHIVPLASSYSSTSSSNAYDFNQALELELEDARIIVMQEATSTLAAALLYDTHALEHESQDPTKSPGGRHATASSPFSVAIPNAQPVPGMESPRSAFDRSQPSYHRSASYAETEGQKSIREYREELSTFSGCIFGSSDIMAYKGTGTKVHIIPTEVKSSPWSYADGMAGRSSMRGSRLAQSYTSNSESLSASFTSHVPARTIEKKKVLITRIFPVPLSNVEVVIRNDRDGYPFPETAPDGTTETPRAMPRPRRTPMYAIAIVLTLPASQAPSRSRTTFRSGSYGDQSGSFPASYGSSKPAGWTVLGERFGSESIDSSFSGDGDDRIEVVTSHWDIIVRTLSHLQSIVASGIHDKLEVVDAVSPAPRASTDVKARTASISVAGKRVEEVRPPPRSARMNAKLVQLTANALSACNKIKSGMGLAQLRIIHGIKAQQVISRQNRWGIWRDEARWIARRAGGKENGFFFYNVLTSFLGTHTEWLQALGPTWYRRRAYQQSRTSKNDQESPLSARTVIVAQDRMTARRLVFLLSAFLPKSQHLANTLAKIHHPSTAGSFRDHSRSPPSWRTAKDQSKRRGSRHKPAHSRIISNPAYENIDSRRLESDLKPGNLSIAGSNIDIIKNKAATTTTVIPVPTIPHFSTRQRVRGTGPVPRPGSSGSLAADDLIRSLKRGENSSSDTLSSSRWGSVSSWSGRMGFNWNKRRGSSAITATTLEEEPMKSSLSQMVEDARMLDAQQAAITSEGLEQLKGYEQANSTRYESPIKSSVNEEDGVIEVEILLPDLFSPFGSAISSPASSGYLSMGPGLEGFEHYSRSSDSEVCINVGGWLPRFHPDFTLQAIADQESLQEEIKAAMRAEPTPVLERPEGSHWVDVTSTLIVDTVNSTVKRLRYRRFVTTTPSTTSSTTNTIISDTKGASAEKSLQASGEPHISHAAFNGQPTPVADAKVEDQFLEEYVVSIDPMLVDAVEKIIAQHTPMPVSGEHLQSWQNDAIGDVSPFEPAAAAGEGLDTRQRNEQLSRVSSMAEVPRGECKKCILGALEEIAHDVAEARNPRHRHKDASDGTYMTENNTKPQKHSLLTEGVISWLVAVENAA